MRTIIKPNFVLFLLFLASSSYTQAQDEKYRRQCYDQLSAVEDYMNDRGYYRSHNFTIDKTGDDGTDYFTATLEGGENYKIVGVCDEDCGDIDLKIFDSYGNLIDEDVETDDLPELSFRTNRTATFEIKVIMYNCGESYCYYGIGVFQD